MIAKIMSSSQDNGRNRGECERSKEEQAWSSQGSPLHCLLQHHSSSVAIETA